MTCRLPGRRPTMNGRCLDLRVPPLQAASTHSVRGDAIAACAAAIRAMGTRNGEQET